MRRLLSIGLAIAAVGLIVVLPAAIGADDGPYKIRGIFDNGSFIAEAQEVRVAGATIGTIESVDVTGPDEVASLEGGPHAVPGKAVVVMNITDDAFKDFRQDASCIIRPQSLIGERLVDCTPTQPRAPGEEPPPELEVIDEGPGEGQRLLPLENNGKSVDLDLIQNMNRMPYADRFRLILNDLGAALAARGDDLGQVVDRANPALRQTNRVLKILADQNQQLADLASNGDAVLEQLAANRTSVTGFLRNAGIAGQATAERGDDLEAQIEKFPETLRQVRATMRDLRGFADEGTPLSRDIAALAPDLSKATQNLPAFFRAGVPALTTLGDAAETAGPKLVAADPVVVQTRDLTKKAGPAATDLAALLSTFNKTNGWEHFLNFVRNTSGNINTYDQYGHFQRAFGLRSNCNDVLAIPVPGCESVFPQARISSARSAGKAEAEQNLEPGVSPEIDEDGPLEEVVPELEPPDPEETTTTEPQETVPEDTDGATQDPSGTAESPGAQAGEEAQSAEPASDRGREAKKKKKKKKKKREAGQRDTESGRGRDAAALPAGRRVVRGGRASSLAASPTLVGAVTVLVVTVAVFLAYQANQGLPFVPTYKLSAQVPNANTLVPGNDVRIGGIRIGSVKTVVPVQQEDGSVNAKLDMELNEDIEPLPVDSTVIVRSRSALGLKYLEIQRGTSEEGFEQGATLPLSSATPEPVEIDEVFNTFDTPTRAAIQANLTEFGNALAGRGVALNAAIGDLRPLVERLEPVMRNLASPETDLSGFVRGLAAAAAEAAPVAAVQGQLFVDLDTTFEAFANVARPYIQETISKSPETEDTAIRTLPRIRPLLRNATVIFANLRPGFAALRPVSYDVKRSITVGVKALRLAPGFNNQLDPTAQALLDFNNDADVREGLSDLDDLATQLQPLAAHIGPAQSVCNYATLLFRNVNNHLAFGDGIGTWQRFIPLNPPEGPNNEGSPSSAPANGGSPPNFLHSNPYPNTASPGQSPRECEAGNGGYVAGQPVIGNVPGNQGIVTEGQICEQLGNCKKKKKKK